MFYHFNQNNSGGYFVEDDKAGVCEDVIIEADTAEEAEERLEKIGETVDGFHEYCPCCGERWPGGLIDDDDGTEQPKIYDTPVDQQNAEMFRKRCFVHYKDGRKVEHVFSA